MKPTSVNRRTFLQSATLLPTLASLPCVAAERPPASGPSPWQIGCYTRPWDEHDYRVALDAIAEAGFGYAGILTAKGKSWVIITPDTDLDEAARIGAEVKQRGLKTVSVYGGDFPLEPRDAGLAGLKRLIECCAACGSPNLLLGGIGDEKQFERYYGIIAEACAFARERHIGLSIKPHGGLNATSPQCRKAIERVGQPNFGLWYDPGNIFYYSEGRLDPVDDAPLAKGLVVGMSVKDYLPPKEVLVNIGEGKVRFREVLARLRDGGFRGGPLVVECLARGSLKQITENARRARLLLEDLVAAA